MSRVTKSFGNVSILQDVSLQIDAGRIAVLLGMNGSGKTTLLRCLSGILSQNSGEVRMDGELFRRDRMDLRQRFCFLPDFPAVFAEMTVIRHVEMMIQLYAKDYPGIEDTVCDLLDEFDLLPLVDCRMGTLSRGQSYKASLVALLAADPELWLFDEPFASGVDPRGLSAFDRHGKAATVRGRTIIYTTQLLPTVFGFADQVCVLHNGTIHDFPNVDDFCNELQRPESEFALAFGTGAQESQS